MKLILKSLTGKNYANIRDDRKSFQEQIATKADILLLGQDIKLLEERFDQKLTMLEQRLTIKMGTIVAAGIGILLALEKLIK